MKIALVTGAAGLIGSEAVHFFQNKFDKVVGLDNDMRKHFFGAEASTAWNVRNLEGKYAKYRHYNVDICDRDALECLFQEYGTDIALIVHCAAQPSHDYAATAPFLDFNVNAVGTLNMLEFTRRHAPHAVFIHCSTNKVYGDLPNALPLVELQSRWECDPAHPFATHGIDESMSIDKSTHSLFGVSKASGDLLVQEYGRYFNIKTACFRGGCLTGPQHSGTQLHGFLNYLMLCAITRKPYTVFGYKGKQVRDNIHAHDLISMFWEFYKAPRVAEVYNAGGSRHSNCSMQEAVTLCEELSGNAMNITYSEANRIGDHIWYISDVRRFQQHYPEWRYQYDLRRILEEIHEGLTQRVE